MKLVFELMSLLLLGRSNIARVPLLVPISFPKERRFRDLLEKLPFNPINPICKGCHHLVLGTQHVSLEQGDLTSR
jgi:hypothetical protein